MSVIISHVLSPILKLWLRSQLDWVDDLVVKILGKDSEILQGKISGAKVSGKHVIYQDLYLTDVNLSSEHIYLNISQIIKNQPLELLAPIQVNLDVFLEIADFQKCLDAPIVRGVLDSYTLSSNSENLEMEVRNLLELLLPQLGDRFTLHQFNVDKVGIRAQGVFTIDAT